MRVLFITNNSIIDHLGIGFLSTELKKNNHITDLVKYNGKNIYAISNKINKLNPHILMYSVTTGQHKIFAELNRKIKTREMISIFGGPHCTFFPEFIKELGVDVIFRGEAECSIVEFCNRFRDYRLSGSKLIPMAAKGTIVKTNDHIFDNGLQTLPQNLDDFEPDRDLLYKYPENASNLIRNFIGQRGCNHSCSYCYNNQYYCLYKESKRIRYKTPEIYIEEIKKTIKKWPTQLIYYQEDSIVADKKWFEELMRLYKKKIKLPCHVHFNISDITEDDIKLLKESNCQSCTFSPEVADESVRFNLLNKHIKNNKILWCADILHKYGIKFRTENILALPMENSLQNDYGTYFFNKKIKADVPWVSLYIPFPKTKLGEYCINNRYFNIDDINNLPKSFFENSPLNKLKYKKCQEKLHKIFMICVNFNIPLWIIKILIRLPFGRLYNIIYKKYKNYLYNRKLYKVNEK